MRSKKQIIANPILHGRLKMRKHGTLFVIILYVAVILSGCFGDIKQHEDISTDAVSKSESITCASSAGGTNNANQGLKIREIRTAAMRPKT